MSRRARGAPQAQGDRALRAGRFQIQRAWETRRGQDNMTMSGGYTGRWGWRLR